MRQWLYVGIIVVIAFIVVGYLQDQGYLDVKWQWLAMAFAVLAGPYKLFKNMLLGGGDKKIEDILAKNETGRKEDKQHREEFDSKLKEKEEQIAKLEKQIELMDTKLQLIEERKKRLPDEVKKMNIDDTKNEFNDLYGN